MKFCHEIGQKSNEILFCHSFFNHFWCFKIPTILARKSDGKTICSKFKSEKNKCIKYMCFESFFFYNRKKFPWKNENINHSYHLSKFI